MDRLDRPGVVVGVLWLGVFGPGCEGFVRSVSLGGASEPLGCVATTEICDNLDNDCDGLVDEDVQNACGNCEPSCTVDEAGAGTSHPFAPPTSAQGVTLTDDGSLTLSSRTAATDFAWPSNDLEGTISRIDTIRDREVARYVTVFRNAGQPSVPDWSTGCNRPSRSTVDGLGNAYVANRAHQDAGNCSSYAGPDRRQASVTKIGLYQEELCTGDLSWCQCVDRNGNGHIDTSKECNGAGLRSDGLCPDGSTPDGIDLENSNEFLGYADECLLWTVLLPKAPTSPVPNANARAMAIEAAGYVWVGDYNNKRFYKLHPDDGGFMDPRAGGRCTAEPFADCAVPVDGNPYGAVVDSYGTLWYQGGGKIQSINTATGRTSSPLIVDNPAGGYGITIDRHDRVWLASNADTLGGGTLVRFDPKKYAEDPNSAWKAFSGGLGVALVGRGITATAEGSIWGAFHQASGGAAASLLIELDDETGAVRSHVDLKTACGAVTSLGVGIDSSGAVWAVNQGSNSACKFDPSTTTVSKVPIGRGPYTYSDFTGNIYRSFTKPEGTYDLIFSGCPQTVVWHWLRWQADTPGASRVEVELRFADTAGGLATATPYATLSQPTDTGIDLRTDVLPGFLLVRLTLFADDDGHVPSVHQVTVAHACIEPDA